MKKWIIGILFALPLWAQAEVCLNDVCGIMIERKAYDEKILPEWNRLRTLSEKLPSIDSQTQFILDNYPQWRDVSIAECDSVQKSLPDHEVFATFKKTCMNQLIDMRVFFLKRMNEQLETYIQP